MWNRFFKSKSSKEGTGKKKKLSSFIRSSIGNDCRSPTTKYTSNNNSKVLSDSEDIIDTGPGNVELVACLICSRTFAPSTLEKHVGICEKMHVQKRTPFDSFRQRREGTGLETYLPTNYGLNTKLKTSKLSPTDTKSVSRSISSIYNDSNKTGSRRVTPTKSDVIKIPSKETPLMNRSMTKRSLGTMNEICLHCGRSFGARAYDRHVEWCREKTKITTPTMSAQQHLAKERMQARIKYKAPTLRSKREKNREKYSSLSESMNNLSDSGGISIMDFNSIADPGERGRKSSIMSLSMTSSIGSDCGYSDKYDPFISAKRQFEDLFNANGITTSTPNKDSSSQIANMSSSSLSTKSTSSPVKNQNLSKSNFRRTSSLRVPKKTSPISFMPKYKPTIQRGISDDEGPISSSFLKPEEFDEIPVKSHAVIAPDLVPKSPKLPYREPSPHSPIIMKRQQRVTRRKENVELKPDFSLTKTDSLAAFLKFEDDLECTPSKDQHLSEKELKDKSNNLNKKSLFELNDNKLSAFTQNNAIKLLPIEKSLVKNEIILEALEMNSPDMLEFNNNNIIRIDEDHNENSIDSNLINSCDNLKISNLSKLPNESSNIDYAIDDISNENSLVPDTRTFSDSPIAGNNDSHRNIELILKNITDSDKRNPKRQLQLDKDNLLFDNAITENDQIENIQDNDGNSTMSRKNSANVSNDLCRKLSHKDIQNIESLFDDFDLEEFISSFSDNEQFPIFKNYKETVSSNRECTPRQHESFDMNEIDSNEKDRTDNSNNRDKCDSFNTSELDQEMIEDKPLEKPDVTAEAEQWMNIESKLNEFDHKKYTTDTKLNQLHDILGECSEISQAERELLDSVQELNSMCEDFQTPDLTSDVLISKRDSPTDTPFKSLFLQSSSNLSNGDAIRHNQRSRHQPIINYQMPEIVGLSSNINRDLSCMSSKLLMLNTDSSKFNTKEIKTNTKLNGFDRVLPPITVHKNDSQNIYNTINMTLNQSDSNHSKVNSAIDSKLSTSKSKLGILKLSRFCHECGVKFIVHEAKFCMECGAKRANLD